MGEDLKLSIQVDKETWRAGDSITIVYGLRNVGRRPLTTLPWGGEYATNWIHGFSTDGSEGAQLEIVRQTTYELKLIPDRTDFINLDPGKSFTRNFTARVSKRSPPKETGGIEASGFSLDFGDSAMLFPGPGQYSLQASFVGMDHWSEEGRRRYGLENVFVGEIKSDKVPVTISP